MNRFVKTFAFFGFLFLTLFTIAVFLYRNNYFQSDNENSNLLVAGSTTLNLFINSLAEEFQRCYPGITVITAGGGSTAGLIAVKKGAIDIGGMSRDLTGIEDDEYTKSYLVARDGVSVVVHGSNPIENLTVDQIRDIFTGKIQDWSEVGGLPASISIFIRDEESTTRGGFEELVMHGDEYFPGAEVFNSHAELSEALRKDHNGIAYFRAFWLKSELGEHIKGLKINGIDIQKKFILSGRYPLTRSLFLVLYDEPSENALKFLEFACSPKGQKVMEERGAVPVY